MNQWHKSRIVIIGGILLVIVILFPPWQFSSRVATFPAERSFIFDPPVPLKYVNYTNGGKWERDESKGVSIGITRMLLECIAITGITTIAFLIRLRFKK